MMICKRLKQSRIFCKQLGFTLIELIMTIVLLGFTLTLLIPFFQAVEHSSDPIVRERTVALGQALMDEILSRRWDENTRVGGGPICTFESGTGRGSTVYGIALDCGSGTAPFASVVGSDGVTNRQLYNDVDDYNDMAAESDIFRDQANVSFDYPGYSRFVQVDYVDSNSSSIDKSPSTPASSTTDTKRIRVTVTNPLGESFVFVALACNF